MTTYLNDQIKQRLAAELRELGRALRQLRKTR